jgi:hypothetical protein
MPSSIPNVTLYPMHANHAMLPLASKPRSDLARNNGILEDSGLDLFFASVFFSSFLFFSYCGILSCVLFPGNAGPSPFERHLQPVSSRPVPACPPGEKQCVEGK